jgi:hypothetical protein
MTTLCQKCKTPCEKCAAVVDKVRVLSPRDFSEYNGRLCIPSLNYMNVVVFMHWDNDVAAMREFKRVAAALDDQTAWCFLVFATVSMDAEMAALLMKLDGSKKQGVYGFFDGLHANELHCDDVEELEDDMRDTWMQRMRWRRLDGPYSC